MKVDCISTTGLQVGLCKLVDQTPEEVLGLGIRESTASAKLEQDPITRPTVNKWVWTVNKCELLWCPMTSHHPVKPEVPTGNGWQLLEVDQKFSQIQRSPTTTILTQIEACLNSRPLVSLTCNYDGVDALTLGHFLVGRPLESIPDPSFYLFVSLLHRWHTCQNLVCHFWRKWSSEYVSSIRKFTKWHHPSRNVCWRHCYSQGRWSGSC